jgi:hypothetical protein
MTAEIMSEWLHLCRSLGEDGVVGTGLIWLRIRDSEGFL